MSTNTPKNAGSQTPTKEEIDKILNDPATTQEAREDIMCHLTGILLARMLTEDDSDGPTS